MEKNVPDRPESIQAGRRNRKVVKLPLDYDIETDGGSLTLFRNKIIKDKKSGNPKPYRERIGYYSTITQVLDGWWKAAVREIVSREGGMELKELLAEIKALEAEARSALGRTALHNPL